jgi:hypothetical protein
MITLYRYPGEAFRVVIGKHFPAKRGTPEIQYLTIEEALAAEPLAKTALSLLGVDKEVKAHESPRRDISGGYLIAGKRGSPKTKAWVYYTGLSGPSFVSADREDALTGLTKEAADKLCLRLNRMAVHHHITFRTQEEGTPS